MPIRSVPKTILAASHDPSLADVRKRTLEGAGYRVIPAMTILEVTNGCKNNKVHLVLIGSSLPPSEKRRVWVEAREHCKTPILELHNGSGPELMQETHTYVHHIDGPEDLLQAVQELIR